MMNRVDGSNYQKFAELTSATNPLNKNYKIPDLFDRDADPKLIRLDHAEKGLCTEAGEFSDELKRHIYYAEPLNEDNLVKELGDVLWYVAEACNALGVTMEDVMAANIAKLQKRFPEGFTEHGALNRSEDDS